MPSLSSLSFFIFFSPSFLSSLTFPKTCPKTFPKLRNYFLTVPRIGAKKTNRPLVHFFFNTNPKLDFSPGGGGRRSGRADIGAPRCRGAPELIRVAWPTLSRGRQTGCEGRRVETSESQRRAGSTMKSRPSRRAAPEPVYIEALWPLLRPGAPVCVSRAPSCAPMRPHDGCGTIGRARSDVNLGL